MPVEANTGREFKKGPEVEVDLTQKLAAVEFRSPKPRLATADTEFPTVPSSSSKRFQLEMAEADEISSKTVSFGTRVSAFQALKKPILEMGKHPRLRGITPLAAKASGASSDRANSGRKRVYAICAPWMKRA